MATVALTQPAAKGIKLRGQSHRESGFAAMLTGGLTLFAIAVEGYHPYAEDGGLYAAGVKRLLDPGLYSRDPEFVLAPMRHSLFAPVLAALVQGTGAGLPAILLALHLLSIWATLLAGWLLATRFGATRAGCTGAVVLLACWLGLPVAGTALCVMDPYVTARSLATPCALLALWSVLETGSGQRHGAVAWGASVLFATAMHPLMAGYALAASMLLLCLQSPRSGLRRWGTASLCAAAVCVAGAFCAWAPVETEAYRHIALTRTYWFLERWRWYEVAGLWAPLGLLAWFGFLRPRKNAARRFLAQTGTVAGACAVLVVLLFARAQQATHLVARMQPLRMFQVCYLLMTLLLGAALGERVLRRATWRWAAALLLLGTAMRLAGGAAYANSAHLELPGVAPENAWTQAFLWIRGNTPRDALFALDADYINAPGEDAQCFRAIAERAALADYSKDGGEASIVPSLTGSWVAGQAAQQRLSTEDDTARRQRLEPRGVSWVVLDRAARTSLACPYRNGAVQVCRLATPGR